MHITFEESATREHYAHVENIILEGISCGVLGVGPQARTVYVYHYPFEEDDNQLKLALGAFGNSEIWKSGNPPPALCWL